MDELGFEIINRAIASAAMRNSLNRYSFNENNSIDRYDLLGLAFYAIGGTWERSDDGANPKQMQLETREQPSRYSQGPGFFFNIKNPGFAISGSDTFGIARKVKKQICKDFCEKKENCKDLAINMTGWSRGATIAMGVAKMLNNEGCSCGGGFLGVGSRKYAPVKVNWIGLFDAVEQVFDYRQLIPVFRTFPRTVPGNVKNFAHAVKTDTSFVQGQLIFPTTWFGRNERAFYKHNGDLTNHGDIGGVNNSRGDSDAYNWIKGEAIRAGVDF